MDNATRKELLYKARAVGYPGSILDVFANYDQGKDLIAEFQQQQQMQQTQQMSDMAAQQVGMQQAPQQAPQQQMQPQVPQIPVVPSSPTPAPNFTPPQPPAPIGVQSQDSPMGIVSGQSGPNQGRAIFATGGFTEQDPPDWRSMLNYKNAAAKQNLVGNVRKVEKPTSVAETTKPVSTPKASAEWKGKSGKQIIEEAKAQEAYNALPEEMKRRDTLTADTRSDAEKFARRTWTAVSQPMETITALNKGYDIPSGYMGMYDAYEGYDVKSPMNFLVGIPAGAPGFIGNAAYRQGEQIVKDPFEYGYTMSPLGMLDPKTRLKSLGNYLDLGAVIPAARGAGSLTKDAGKFLTTQTPLKNAYKYNPLAFKPNESNWYRQVGKSAVDDALGTKVIREAGEEVSPRMLQEFEEQLVRMQGNGMEAALASRRPASPFFLKGELFYPMGRKPTITKSGKISKNSAGKGDSEYLIETSLPNESFQPAYVKGMGLGVPTEIGQTAILKPNPSLRNIENFNFYKQNWLRGYKKIKKETGGFKEDKCYTCVGRKRRV